MRTKGGASRPRPHPFAGKSKRRGPLGFSLEQVSAQAGAIVAAVGIGAIIADSGAMAAGDYRVMGHMGSDGVVAAGKGLELAHRNAANNADVRILAFNAPACSSPFRIDRITLAANERIVARGGAVAHGVGERAQAYIQLIAIPS